MTEKDDSQEKSKKPKRKMSLKNKLLVLVFSAAAIYFLKQGVVLLLVGMIPASVAYLVDTTPHRSWSKTVFCFNLAGLMPTLADIAIGHESSQGAIQAKMSDPFMWLIAYSGAALGWIVIWLCPIIIEQLLILYYQHCVDKHQAKLTRIDDEWNVTAATQ